MHHSTTHHHYSSTLPTGISLHSPSSPSSSASNLSIRARSPSLSLDDPGHHHFCSQRSSLTQTNSLSPASYVRIKTYYSSSTGSVTESRESPPTDPSSPPRDQYHIPSLVTSSRPLSIRLTPDHPERQDQATFQLRRSPKSRRSRFQPSLTPTRSWFAHPRRHPRRHSNGLWSRPVQSSVQAPVQSHPNSQPCVPMPLPLPSHVTDTSLDLRVQAYPFPP